MNTPFKKDYITKFRGGPMDGRPVIPEKADVWSNSYLAFYVHAAGVVREHGYVQRGPCEFRYIGLNDPSSYDPRSTP